MSVRSLFWQRYKRYSKKQFTHIKMMCDWTVMVYILIPFIIFLGVNHYHWWIQTPSWVTVVPQPLFIGLLLLISLSGQVLFFFEAADLLFVYQRPHWHKGLMYLGIRFAFIRDALYVFIIGFFVLPLLLNVYSFSPLKVISFGVLLLISRQAFKYLYQVLDFHIDGILRDLLFWGSKFLYIIVCLNCLSLWEYHIGSFVCLCFITSVVLGLLIKYRLTTKGKFMTDVSREEKWSNRFGAFIVGQVNTGRKSIFAKKRPLLLRRSQSIYRGMDSVNGLADLYLKSRIRDGGWISFYLQMFAYSVVALILLPSWVKIVAFFGTTLLFAHWLRGSFQEDVNHSFLTLYHINKEEQKKAFEKVYKHAFWPSLALQSLVFGVMMYGFYGLMVAMAGVYFYHFIITNLMLSFIDIGQKERG